jgi:hypothetical protein
VVAIEAPCSLVAVDIGEGSRRAIYALKLKAEAYPAVQCPEAESLGSNLI